MLFLQTGEGQAHRGADAVPAIAQVSNDNYPYTNTAGYRCFEETPGDMWILSTPQQEPGRTSR